MYTYLFLKKDTIGTIFYYSQNYLTHVIPRMNETQDGKTPGIFYTSYRPYLTAYISICVGLKENRETKLYYFL